MESVFSVLLSIIYSFSFVLCSSSRRIFGLRGALPLWWYKGCLWELIFTKCTRTFTGKFDIIVSIWTWTYDNRIKKNRFSKSWPRLLLTNFKIENLIKRRKLQSRLFGIKNRFFWMPQLLLFTTLRKKK